MGARRPKKPYLYQHTPNVIDEFGPEDLLVNTYPLPGIDFHNNPRLDAWLQMYGEAPDTLFRQGLAAPPLDGNVSGIRHYMTEFTGDPNKIINLDVPLSSQTKDVQEILREMGLDGDLGEAGKPSIQEGLWEKAIGDAALMQDVRDAFGEPLTPKRVRNLSRSAVEGSAGGESPNLQNLIDSAADEMLGDLRGFGLEGASRQGTGRSAGAAFAPPRRMAGTKEYKIFDPSSVEIRRIASILAALGLGTGVAQAGSGESTGDSTKPPRYPEGATSDFTKQAPQQEAKNGESLIERLTRAGAKEANRIFGNDIDPKTVQSHLASLPDDQYRQLRGAFERAMNMPVVRLDDGKVMTPNQYLDRMVEVAGVSPSAKTTAISSLIGMPYSEKDTVGLALRDELLNQLKANLPAMDTPGSWDTSATQEQYQQFVESSPYGEARWRLTPEGEQAYQGERVYNLLSTFQNGEHAPIYSDPASKVLGVAGAAFFPATSYIHAAVGDYGGTTDTAKLAAARFNGVQGRVDEGLYWWNRGEPDGTAADSYTGAKYPSLSSTTLAGVGRKMSSTDNVLPKVWNQIPQKLVRDPFRSFEELAALQNVEDQVNRVTPIRAPGATGEETRDLRRDIGGYLADQREFLPAMYPKAMHEYVLPASDTLFGTSNQPDPYRFAPSQRPPRVTYLSPASEAVVQLGADMPDPSFAIGPAAKLFGGLLKGANAAGDAASGSSSFGRAMGEFAGQFGDELKEELPLEYLQHEDNKQPGESWFAPKKGLNVMGLNDAGFPVQADDPEYPRYYEKAVQDQEKVLRGILDRGTKMYQGGRPRPQASRAIQDRMM